MMMTTLLCPHFAPPPHFLVLGGLFLVATCVLPLTVLYRLFWVLRYHRASLMGQGCRVRGRVVGPGEPGDVVYGRRERGDVVSRPFVVETPDGPVKVSPRGALLRSWPRRVWVGQKVTVDGYPATLPREDETLYRDAPVEHGVEAMQVMRGTWPQAAGLVRAATAVWVVLLVLVMGSIH